MSILIALGLAVSLLAPMPVKAVPPSGCEPPPVASSLSRPASIAPPEFYPSNVISGTDVISPENALGPEDGKMAVLSETSALTLSWSDTFNSGIGIRLYNPGPCEYLWLYTAHYINLAQSPVYTGATWHGLGWAWMGDYDPPFMPLHRYVVIRFNALVYADAVYYIDSPRRWWLPVVMSLGCLDRGYYADPTPNVGGPTWDFRKSGSQDNRDLEARPDVLTYTSAPLERDLDVIGPVSAELFVHSNLEHTDFFARLCDVEPSGRSMNVCDGILRLAPGRPAPEPDGCRKIAIELWPTAYQFKQGHRIRVQVSSGAFPRWSRNLGSGEPLTTGTTGTTMRIAEQSVYHDPEHLSVIFLSYVLSN